MVLCAKRCPQIFTFDSCRGPLGGLKKTWVLVPDMVQLVGIQDGFQDGRLKILNSSDYQVIYQILWFHSR